MLSFNHRFHGHGSLRYVYKNGRTIRSQRLTLKYIDNRRRDHSRFAVVVSKKVLKSAAGRNRIRRRIYEIIRHEIPRFTPSYDVVVIVFSSEVAHMPHEELVLQLRDMFAEAGLYQKRR